MTHPAAATTAAALALALAISLAACQSAPPMPDWQTNAIGHLQRFADAYLTGEDRVASREFKLARQQTQRTANAALLARVELHRCALQTASLDWQHCHGFERLRADAPPHEQAYARYLRGQADEADTALLPTAQRGAAGSAKGANAQALADVADPASRLLAAAVHLRRGTADARTVAVAVDTASAQGWRRPLRAWLGVQARMAQETGDASLAALASRRLQLLGEAAADKPGTAPTTPTAPTAPASRPATGTQP